MLVLSIQKETSFDVFFGFQQFNTFVLFWMAKTISMISELPLRGSFRICTNGRVEASRISGRSGRIIYSRAIFCFRFELFHLRYPPLELFVLALLVRMSLVLDMKL